MKVNFFYGALLGTVNVLHLGFTAMDATVLTVATMLRTRLLDKRLLKLLWRGTLMPFARRLVIAHMQ